MTLLSFYKKACFVICLFSAQHLIAQITDTTSLVYDTVMNTPAKKSLFGKLEKSITTDAPKPTLSKTGTIKNDLAYNKYKGYTIRNIYFNRIGFNKSFSDTTKIKHNFGVRLANAFHKQSQEKLISKNLFFAKGDKINPYVLADNDRFLRELFFLQDAKIVINPIEGDNSLVDITVITKDVFSLGLNVNASSADNFDIELKDENFLGKGQRLSLQTLYDVGRTPRMGYGGEFTGRNVGGSFCNTTLGFKTFNSAFNSGRAEETTIYAGIDKPLVSAYMPFTGALNIVWHKTSNNFIGDSLHATDYKYEYLDVDAWGGFNINGKRMLKKNLQNRMRKFIAARVTHQQFLQVPGIYQNTYNYRYANLTAVIGSFTIFKQNFYKTKFIYGFGRQEDVPEGFSLAFIGGYTNKQDKQRPYYGVDFGRFYFNKKGSYFNYTFRFGGYQYDGSLEDVDMLLNLEHFTKLKQLSRRWQTRNFTNFGITHQIRPLLNQPLFLSSPFGIQEISNGVIAAQTRFTATKEKVWYNTWKLLGFRFAPFVFGKGILLTPTKETFAKSDFFSSLGVGIRTRNESLVFGTIEVRGSYFPRLNPGMQHFKIDVTSELRFKYNSQFIKRPDFVLAN